MRGAAFRDWLDANYKPKTASSRFSEASRVEASYGDLDIHFARDGLAAIDQTLTYGRKDEIAGRPNLTKILIDGNIRNGLGSLKSAIRCYGRFLNELNGMICKVDLQTHRMNLLAYRVDIIPLSADDGGGFTAIAPELPGCRSDGETPQEALDNVYDAIACWIEAAREMGRPIPQPRRAAA